MNVEKELKQLRKRIKQLEKEKRKKRVWYREISNWMSLAALGIALATLIYQYQESASEDYSAKVSRFRGSLNAVVYDTAQMRGLSSVAPQSDMQRMQLSTQIEQVSTRLLTDLNLLQTLYPLVKQSLRADELLTFAEALSRSSQPLEIDIIDLYQNGIQMSDSNVDKAHGMRLLAGYLYKETPNQDISRAESLFAEASILIGAEKTVENQIHLMQTHFYWATALAQNSQLERAQEKLSETVKIWESIPSQIRGGNRQMWLEYERFAKAFHLNLSSE